MHLRQLLFMFLVIVFTSQAVAQNCSFQIQMAADTIACATQFPPPIGSSSPSQFSMTPYLQGGVAATYLWSDGLSDKTFFPPGPGTYTVTVTDVSGCAVSSSVVVRKYGDPGSSETPALTVTKLCFGSPTELTGHGSSIDRFTMTFGDGNFSLPEWNPMFEHTFGSVGPFNASLRVTNRCGLDVVLGSIIDLSSPPPNPTIPATIPICNSPASLDANTNNVPNLTYRWSDGSTNKTLSVANPGGISVTVTNNAGCSTTASTVAFDGRPLVDLGPDQSVCQPVNGPILDAHNNGSTYQWTINGANASINQTIQASTLNTGVFEYIVTITNPLTSCVTSDAVVIKVNGKPADPTIILSDGRNVLQPGVDLSVCQLSDASVTATYPLAASFAWSLNGASVATGSRLNVPTSTTGILDYTMDLKVMATGCTSQSPFSLNVKSPPEKPFIKLVSATVLESSATTGNQWYKDGVVLAGKVSRQLTPTQPGNYAVKSSVNTCSSPLSDAFTFGITDVDKEEIVFKTYPNPASELLYLTFGVPDVSSAAQIFIIDMTGKTQLQQHVENNSALVISDLMPGLYTIMAIRGSRTDLQRFLKY